MLKHTKKISPKFAADKNSVKIPSADRKQTKKNKNDKQTFYVVKSENDLIKLPSKSS